LLLEWTIRKSFGGVYEKHGFRVFKLEKDSPWPSKISPKPVTFFVFNTSLPELALQRAKELARCGAIILQRRPDPKIKIPTTCFLKKALKTEAPLMTLSGPSFAKNCTVVFQRRLFCLAPTKRGSRDSHKTSQQNKSVYTETSIRWGLNFVVLSKNVYALAAGACDGLSLGNNARTALNTRALSEMSRVVTFLAESTLLFLVSLALAIFLNLL